MERPEEMRYNEAMRQAERTDELMQDAPAKPRVDDPSWRVGEAERRRILDSLTASTPPSRIRPTIEEVELLDIVDGLTAHLAYGRLTELEFYRVRDTRDRFARMLEEIAPGGRR